MNFDSLIHCGNNIPPSSFDSHVTRSNTKRLNKIDSFVVDPFVGARRKGKLRKSILAVKVMLAVSLEEKERPIRLASEKREGGESVFLVMKRKGRASDRNCHWLRPICRGSKKKEGGKVYSCHRFSVGSEP